jgi:putative transposase
MENKKYKSNNNIIYSCTYHVVWCPKYRRKVLVGPVAARLKELIVETCTGLSVEIQEMEIMPDHVHLLLDIDPQFGVHKAVKRIKGVSSRVLRQEFKELTTKLPTLWSNSYFVSTVGGAPLEMIQAIHPKPKNLTTPVNAKQSSRKEEHVWLKAKQLHLS